MSESQTPSVAEVSPKRRHYPEDFQRDAVRLVTDEKYTFKAVARLRESATSITNLPVVNYSADPADNLILATAIAGLAELLVTGDKKHLLSLGKVEAVSIVTVNDALDRLNPPEQLARKPR